MKVGDWVKIRHHCKAYIPSSIRDNVAVITNLSLFDGKPYADLIFKPSEISWALYLEQLEPFLLTPLQMEVFFYCNKELGRTGSPP